MMTTRKTTLHHHHQYHLRKHKESLVCCDVYRHEGFKDLGCVAGRKEGKQ